MTRPPRPFTFRLLDAEVAEIVHPSGRGGHQSLHRLIRDQLKDGKNIVRLDDAQLGMLFRYMTQYKGGGFQARLRRAFLRSVYELLAVPIDQPNLLR